MSYQLYTDGASRGNPGKACAGIVIKEDSKTIFKDSKYLGDNITNNIAEYSSLEFGLESLINNEYNISKLEIFMDSKLVISQLKGEWKLRNNKFIPLFYNIKEMLKRFPKVKLNHIPRKLNQEADEMANHKFH